MNKSEIEALVDHLQNYGCRSECEIHEDREEAAEALTAALAEIDTLRTENKIFRGSLADIHDGEPEWPNDPQKELDWCRNRAREALKGADQ